MTTHENGASAAQSESDANDTSPRAAWQAAAFDMKTRALLGRDAHHFLRLSVSTPCLNAIVERLDEMRMHHARIGDTLRTAAA